MKKIKQETLDSFSSFAKDVTDNLYFLYQRWQKKMTKENWEDYSAAMKKFVEDTPAEFIRASKKPFGMVVKFRARKETIKMGLYAKPGKVYYKTVH